MTTLAPESINYVLDNLFDVNLEGIRTAPSIGEGVPAARLYFRKALSSQIEAIHQNQAYVADIFHVLVGLGILAEPVPDGRANEIRKYLLNLRADSGFLPVSRLSPRAKILTDRELPPDIYSSLYAIMALEMLGTRVQEGVANALAEWVTQQKDTTGWFFNLGWADTTVERKLQNELSRQTLSAILLLQKLGKSESVPGGTAQTVEVLRGFVKHVKYMGPLEQSIRSLTLLDQIDEPSLNSAAAFVQRHFDDASGGFFEYLFQEAKVDEVAGQVQRYQYDHLEPSILATYRALQIVALSGDRGELATFWAAHSEAVTDFFQQRLPTEDGVGTIVRIAKFDQPYGPVTTPLETLAAMAAPALISRLSRHG